MISVQSVGKLYPTKFHASASKSMAISVSDDEPSLVTWDCPNFNLYIPQANFDENVGMIYEDEHGTPMSISSPMFCNLNTNIFPEITLANANSTYFMTTGDIFNTTVYPFSSKALPYNTPCWLSTGWETEPTPPVSSTNYQCTYVTVYHDQPTIDLSSNISLDKYSNATLSMGNTTLLGNNYYFWWLTEVTATVNGHKSYRFTPNTGASSVIFICQLWDHPWPYDGDRGSYDQAWVYVPERPSHEIELSFKVNWGGTAINYYYFQDSIQTGGHNNYGTMTGGLGEFPHKAMIGAITPDSSTLATNTAIYASTTPSSAGGTNLRPLATSGWYRLPSWTDSNLFYYWDSSIGTWTKSRNT